MDFTIVENRNGFMYFVQSNDQAALHKYSERYYKIIAEGHSLITAAELEKGINKRLEISNDKYSEKFTKVVDTLMGWERH